MSDKVRVYEIAEEAGASSSEVIDKAKDLDIKLTSPQSAVSYEDAEEIANYIMTGKSKLLKKSVYMIAAEAGTSSLNVIEKAGDLGINIQSTQARVSYNNANEIITYIKTGKSKKLVKTKVNQLALKLGISSKAVIKKAKDLGYNIKSAQTGLSKDDTNKIITYITTGKSSTKDNILESLETTNNKIKIYQIAEITEIPSDRIITEAKEIGINLDNLKDEVFLKDAKRIINNIGNEKKLDNNSNKLTVSKKTFSDISIDYKFKYKNILFKGVPGTGKSRIVNKIIRNQLNIKDENNILRINIHSSTSNSDLMQGIGINANNGNIEYIEKQGLILKFIENAIFNPFQPFALVLEEIQENSLNELIGDLIYLIEDNKRTEIKNPDNKKYTYDEIIHNILNTHENIQTVKVPSLVNTNNVDKQMILPSNLYIFCTSNYRDDKKIIEDNLLRRFDVIEIAPKYKNELKESFKNQEVSDFLENLNKSVLKVFNENGEIHPDRFMFGHSIWLDVNDKKSFMRAFLKVITEFKDIKDVHFDDFSNIIKEVELPFEIDSNQLNYQEWIHSLQLSCYDFID